jgi:tRNA 2-thiocytidine biosynthesis protein TtcA
MLSQEASAILTPPSPLEPKISKPQGQEYKMSKKIGRAIKEYGLIEDGDRILVGVSGGKDSLCLLRILHDRLTFVPIKYSLIAVVVDSGCACQKKAKLVEYFRSNNFAYRIENCDILAGIPKKELNCFWCSWNRRKVLFQTAKKLRCNKIALGHHKDDIIETILLNLLFKGEISGMKPKQEFFSGKLSIIRPLAFIEEHETEQLAKELKLPVTDCICPNSLISQRTFIRSFIASVQKVSPNVKSNIFRSLSRIRKDYLL